MYPQNLLFDQNSVCAWEVCYCFLSKKFTELLGGRKTSLELLRNIGRLYKTEKESFKPSHLSLLYFLFFSSLVSILSRDVEKDVSSCP